MTELLVQQFNRSSFLQCATTTLYGSLWGDWYASDNNLRGTPRGKPEEAESGQVAHTPSLDGRAVPWPWGKRHGQSMAWVRHGHGMASVNQTRLHCVNQMGKIHSKPLAARHGRGKAWSRHGHGMLCVNRPLMKKRRLPSMPNHKLGKSVFPNTIRSLVLYIMMSQTSDDILQDT
jgi:hypothetical protein